MALRDLLVVLETLALLVKRLVARITHSADGKVSQFGYPCLSEVGAVLVVVFGQKPHLPLLNLM